MPENEEDKVETTAQPEQQPEVEKAKADELLGPDGKPWDPERAMATINTLREEAKGKASLEKKLAEYEKAEHDRKEAEMSEAEKLKAKLEKAEAEAATLRRQQLQREIAEKVGLPSTLALRLQGDTADEMEADAKSLLESLPKSSKQTTISATNPGANATGNLTREQREAQIMENVFGRPVNPFDPDLIRKQGGGVVFKTED